MSLKRKRDPSPDSTDTSSSSELEQVKDDPVLSHAAKRKQKKALLKESIPSTKKRKKTEQDTTTIDHPSKRQNSIWVGNLCYKTTPDSLRRFFDGVGEITRVHLPTKFVSNPAAPSEPARRENRGFAYVDFATPDAKKSAIMMTEQPLEGRRLLIKDGDSFDGRPPKPRISHNDDDDDAERQGQVKSQTKFARKILDAQKQSPAPTLFLGNLGFETTVDSIRGLLEAHRSKKKKKKKETAGDDAGGGSASGSTDDKAKKDDPWIRKIRMGTFEDSGLCKGFAFVDFTSIEHATAALIHPKNHQLDGRKLVVEYASADAVRRGGGGGAGPRPKNVKASGGEGHSHRKKKLGSTVDDRADERDLTTMATTMTIKKSKPQEEEKGRRGGAFAKAKVTSGTSRKSRPTPGAALALAKREQVAIVPSQGRRITFDD
ncbi:hypothetical protein BGW80DRAFT_1283929 [Lactifluus volemus]|nr:hypothetical protein BGW80DRAFT_1283929 [Lactifluus volemus]